MSGRGTIITFYSYKGGVGRTFALASVGAQLARWGLRVLLVDWDLEAPGLTSYLPVDRGAHGDQSVGMVPMFRDFQGGQLPWREHLLRPVDPGVHLDILPAGEGEADLGGVAQQIRWEELYADQDLGAAIEAMSAEWRAAYDVVLIDSRTGFSDTTGICIIQIPDMVVLLGTASRQSFRGLSDIADRIVRGRAEYPSERAGGHLIPVLTRFEGRVEHDRAREWMETFERELGGRTDSWLAEQAPRTGVLTALRVPHVPYWSFGEELPSPDAPATPDDVGWALENLAALLEHRLEGAERLADDRDSYVKESRTRRDPYPVEVVIVALPDELRRAQELASPYPERVIVAGPQEQEQIARGRHVVFMVGDLNGQALDRAGGAVLRLWASRADLEDTSLSVLKVGTAAVPRSLQSQVVLGRIEEKVGRSRWAAEAPLIAWEPAATVSIDAEISFPRAWRESDGQREVVVRRGGVSFGGRDVPWRDVRGALFNMYELTKWDYNGDEITENVPRGVFVVADPTGTVPEFRVHVWAGLAYDLLRLARATEGMTQTTISDDLIKHASQ